MDIVEVLKILSKQSGLNIVVGKNVSGRVTVFLTNVDFWEALRIILETRDLAYVKDGDMVKICYADDVKAQLAAFLAAKYSEPITNRDVMLFGF